MSCSNDTTCSALSLCEVLLTEPSTVRAVACPFPAYEMAPSTAVAEYFDVYAKAPEVCWSAHQGVEFRWRSGLTTRAACACGVEVPDPEAVAGDLSACALAERTLLFDSIQHPSPQHPFTHLRTSTYAALDAKPRKLKSRRTDPSPCGHVNLSRPVGAYGASLTGGGGRGTQQQQRGGHAKPE